MKEDRWIEQAAKEGMIEPFVAHQVKQEEDRKIISYGLSSYGYDIRVSNHYKVFTNVFNSLVDPKNFTEDAFVDMYGDSCIIPPIHLR